MPPSHRIILPHSTLTHHPDRPARELRREPLNSQPHPKHRPVPILHQLAHRGKRRDFHGADAQPERDCGADPRGHLCHVTHLLLRLGDHGRRRRRRRVGVVEGSTERVGTDSRGDGSAREAPARAERDALETGSRATRGNAGRGVPRGGSGAGPRRDVPPGGARRGSRRRRREARRDRGLHRDVHPSLTKSTPRR